METKNNRPWLSHYDPAVPESIDYPDIPVFAFFEETASKYPGQPCTVFRDRSITYAEMNTLADRLAAARLVAPFAQPAIANASSTRVRMIAPSPVRARTAWNSS